MDGSSAFDTRRSRVNAGGGQEVSVMRFGAGRQPGIGHMRHRDSLLPDRMVERNALSAALLAERDLSGVDYASGAGY